MHRSRFLHRAFAPLAIVTLLALVASCASEDDPGSAPVLSNLVADPARVDVGTSTMLALGFDLEDPDADAMSWDARLEHDGTAVARSEPSAIAGAAGQILAHVDARLAIVAPVAGDYVLVVRVHDANGNTSNEVTAAIVAE